MKKKNWFQKIIWRLQFKKVNLTGEQFYEGRCVNCAAGNPIVECSYYYCPCNEDQHLKRVRNFNLKWEETTN